MSDIPLIDPAEDTNAGTESKFLHSPAYDYD